MKKLITLLIAFTTTALVAQNSYQRGYFKDNDGKITECLIYNIAWMNNPTEFQYKFSEADAGETKTIKDVSEFSVDNAYKFVRFTTEIERSSTDVAKLDRYPEFMWNTETLFLNVLVEGKINLYMYEYGSLIKYFYSTGDHTKAVQLLYKEYNDRSSIRKNYQYRQQLYNLMKDKISSESRYGKIKYTQSDLVKLFNEYNAGEEKSTDYADRKNKGSLNFKAVAGGSFASLEVSNAIGDYNMDFGTTVSFRAGAEVEYKFAFNNNKWSIFLDPHFAYYKNDGENDGTRFAAEYSSLEVPAGIRHYFYVGPQTTIFLDGMMSFDFPVGDSFVSYNDKKLPNGNTTHLAFGGGVSWGKISGEVRYNLARGIMETLVWESDYSRLDLIVAFKIL